MRLDKCNDWPVGATRALGRVDWACGWSAAALRAAFDAGRASLYALTDGGRPCGYTVLSVDGAELVVMAVAGGTGTRAGRLAYGRCVRNLAAREGARMIRAHTSRPGMCRVLADLGFRAREMVFEAPVHVHA